MCIRDSDGAIDKAFEIRLHQACMRPFRHVAGESQALFGLIDAENGTYHRLLLRSDTQCQREEQSGGRQSRGVLAKVPLVPVSYTHLDVYKRQARYMALSALFIDPSRLSESSG